MSAVLSETSWVYVPLVYLTKRYRLRSWKVYGGEASAFQHGFLYSLLSRADEDSHVHV